MDRRASSLFDSITRAFALAAAKTRRPLLQFGLRKESDVIDLRNFGSDGRLVDKYNKRSYEVRPVHDVQRPKRNNVTSHSKSVWYLSP